MSSFTSPPATPSTPAGQPPRHALVTGANKGIGLAIAHGLAAAGFTPWLGCRDPGRGEQAAARLRAAGHDAHVLALDVTDAASVDAAAARLAEQVPALDVLVNNAGISLGTFAPPSTERLDDLRAIFEVNFFGPFCVTQAFLPLLRRAPAARIVMMSSSLGSVAETGNLGGDIWGVPLVGYCASKSALNMLTVKLAKELLADNIKVNAANPGYTATDLNGHSGSRTPAQAAEIAVRLATLGPLGPTGGFFQEPAASVATELARVPW